MTKSRSVTVLRPPRRRQPRHHRPPQTVAGASAALARRRVRQVVGEVEGVDVCVAALGAVAGLSQLLHAAPMSALLTSQRGVVALIESLQSVGVGAVDHVVAMAQLVYRIDCPIAEQALFGLLLLGFVTAARTGRFPPPCRLCKALARLGTRVGTSIEMADALEQIVRNATSLMRGRGAIVRLLDVPGDRLVAEAHCGLSANYMSKGDIIVARSPVDQQALSGAIVTSFDSRHDRRFQYPAELLDEGLGGMICAPVTIASQPRGVIRLYHSHCHTFGATERWLISVLADYAGIAIGNALKYGQLLAAMPRADELVLTGGPEDQ